MSSPWGEPWSNNPNAPQIPSWLYNAEKYVFAGRLIDIIVYGIVVALFFQCIGALIDPINTMRKSVKWGLVAHTTALFLFLTMGAMMAQCAVFIEYLDNLDFPGTDKAPPGPIGYTSVHSTAGFPVYVYSVVFPLSQWLADGLLLYRCYVIFSKNYRVMVFPCLLYTASVVTGIMNTYYYSALPFLLSPAEEKTGVAYFPICLSLNVLLTLMIITRLVLHKRNIRHSMGTSDGTSKLYTTIIIMFIESYALYAIAFISYIISSTLGASVSTVFSRLLGGIQVIASYLIVLRVAKGRALTSEMTTSGSDNVSSIRFRSQGTTDGDGLLPDHNPTSSMQADAKAPDELGARGQNSIEVSL